MYEGAKSAESESESIWPSPVPHSVRAEARMDATYANTDCRLLYLHVIFISLSLNKQSILSEEAQSMESCRSENIWVTPPCKVEDERDGEDSLPMKAFYQTD